MGFSDGSDGKPIMDDRYKRTVASRSASELASSSKEPRQETNRRRSEVKSLHEALAEIIEPKEIGGWMDEPSDAFDGSTPLQVLERGEIDRIWHMIYAVRTGHPG
jgi:hypothetical protein